jgi:hypothetical protein
MSPQLAFSSVSAAHHFGSDRRRSSPHVTKRQKAQQIQALVRLLLPRGPAAEAVRKQAGREKPDREYPQGSVPVVLADGGHGLPGGGPVSHRREAA